MLGTDPQSIGSDHFRDFCHRPGRFETEIAHDDERFVHQHARALLQFRHGNARIDVAVIIRAAHHDVRRVPRGRAKKSADAIRRRSHFLDDLLQLLDHLLGFDDRLLVLGNIRAHAKQLAANRFARRQRGNQVIKRLKQSPGARAFAVALPSFATLVAHLLWFGSIRRTDISITLSRLFRNASTRADRKMFN